MSKNKTKNMIEKYILLSLDENIHEYDLHVTKNDEDTLYELFCSNNDIWSNHRKGSYSIGLIDTGNGIKIKMENASKLDDELDYDVAAELNILLNVVTELSNFRPKFKLTKQSNNEIIV
jgi:hypothetical protein